MHHVEFWQGVVMGFLANTLVVILFFPGMVARSMRNMQGENGDSDEGKKRGDEWKPKGWKPDYYED